VRTQARKQRLSKRRRPVAVERRSQNLHAVSASIVHDQPAAFHFRALLSLIYLSYHHPPIIPWQRTGRSFHPLGASAAVAVSDRPEEVCFDSFITCFAANAPQTTWTFEIIISF